jgi:hypothetical protein
MRKSAFRWVRRTAMPTIWAFALAMPASAQSVDPCNPPPTASVGIEFEEHAGARRESEMVSRPAVANVPTIGFIDSPSAICYQPNPAADVCWINWYYLSVDASPNYMICMEATINAIGKVSRVQGFFQTSMYVPYNMHDRGFRVACGAPGSGGYPDLGAVYAYTIRARDSANLGSANYGTVICPPFAP